MSFHVPEVARLERHPLPEFSTTAADGNNGAFIVASVEPGWALFFIASDGLGWEHVSVTARRVARGEQVRTPTWKEMHFIKSLCWDPEDVVMQLHPRASEYVNCHPNCLHLWRPLGAEIPTPPAMLVGPVTRQETPVP